jgi:hypothetical protein
MDAARFDAVARTFATRPSRRLLLAIGLAVTVGARQSRPAAALCRADGAKCGTSSECCSGHCAKKGKKKRGKKPKKRCAVIPESAFGCTIDDDTCVAEAAVSCPDIGGGACVILDGRPFCARRIRCELCTRDSDCETGERCITSCDICAPSGGLTGCLEMF